MIFKHLNWKETNVGYDNINREIQAEDDIKANPYGRGIYILYCVHMFDYNYKEGREVKPIYKASIFLNGSDTITCECNSFEDGKKAVEEWREAYWNSILNEINTKLAE